jgi:hypothetical protein
MNYIPFDTNQKKIVSLPPARRVDKKKKRPYGKDLRDDYCVQAAVHLFVCILEINLNARNVVEDLAVNMEKLGESVGNVEVFLFALVGNQNYYAKNVMVMVGVNTES